MSNYTLKAYTYRYMYITVHSLHCSGFGSGIHCVLFVSNVYCMYIQSSCVQCVYCF